MAKIGTAKAIYTSAPSKTVKTKTAEKVVFTPVSDETLVKEYLQNYAKPEDIIPTLLPHLKNGLPGNNQPKAVVQKTNAPIPSVDNVPDVYRDAIQRNRLKGLGLETLNDDIQNAGKEYEKVIGGWQDQKTLSAAKPVIENTYNKLKNYRTYLEDYGGDTTEISKQIKAYKEVLDGWNDLSADYGKYASADEYNNAIKQGKFTKEELLKIREEIKPLETEYTLYENSIQNPESGGLYLGKYAQAQEKLNKALNKYGIDNIEQLRELIKNAEARAVTVDNKKSLYQYQVEIDSLEYVIEEAKAIDKKRVAAIRKNDSQAEQDALKEMQTLLGNNGYKTIDGARQVLSQLKGERNSLRTYKVGTEEYSKELTAVTDPETVFYNEGAEDYIKKGEKSEKYKEYYNSEEYKFLTKAELRTLAYYIAKDEETGKGEAEKFLEDLTETLNTREGKAYYKRHLEDNTFTEILYSVPVGLDQFASGMKNLFNTDDDYIPISSTQIAGQLARADLEEVKLPKWLGGFSLAGVAYDSLSTISNMAPSILSSFVSNAIVPGSGAVVGGTLMGASAAGNAYQEALNSGMDKSQARTYSTLVGVSEAALSAVLSKVMGGKALSGKVQTAIDGIENGFVRFAANYGTAFVSEGMEEGIQEILTPFFENFALGYNKNGFEDIDWGEVAYSFLLGGLSGGMFETIGTAGGKVINHFKNVSQTAKTYNTGTKIANLIEIGLGLPKESKAYKTAQSLNALVDSGNKISKNKLYNLVVASENIVSDRLMQLGETNNVSAVASAVVKRLTGAELSINDIEALSKSSYGQEVLRTIVPKAESENTVETENSLRAGADNDIIENNQETGVDIDGGQQDGYDNQRSGRTIHAAGIKAGTVQENVGRNHNQSGTERIQQRGNSEIRNQGNNQRIEPTQEQKESLKTTAIKDENGNPKEVSHFTDNMDFETFEIGDIGFHFGNEEQAIERGKILKKAGRIIKAYLDIKNPVKISSDIMCWWPEQTAFRLCVDEIISKEEYIRVSDLQSESGHDYNSHAAIELRKILADKGYDGIVYENMFEAEGESYIAFYPEQVITIDDGKANTEADPEGPANFMPENSLDEGALGSGNNSFGLTEPTDQEIYRDPTAEENAEAIFGKRKNAKQRHILDVAKKLDSGIKVVFVDANAPVLSGQKGVYMRESNTIYLSESNSVVDSYYQVFKHEFIHRLESKGAYKGFKNYLFKHSAAFEKYARAQLGKDFKGTREEALQALAQHYIDKVQKGSFSEKYKKSFNEEAAQREMVADFISEVLFKGDRADVAQSLAEGDIDSILDIEDTLAEFEKLNDTDRNWFQKIVDWVRDLIASLKGVKQNERLVKDLEYIEQRLARVLDSRDTKKAAKNSGGIMYCFREKTPNVFNPKGVSLNEQLEDAYETSDSFDQRYVYVGIFSKDFAELLKKNNINLHNYPIAMNYRDAYLSMRSKETGKYHGEGINYHNLGIDGLCEALESFKNPQHIMKSKKDGKIELALQTVDKKGNNILSIIAVNTVTLNGNKMLNAHIVTSVYGKRNIENYISKARNEGRIIEPNKEEFSQGTPQVQYEGSINENSSNDIILNHEPDVKDIISEEGENYSETDEKGEGSFSLGSPAQQMRENRKRYESGEITQEEYQEETDNLWGKANETYGMFETGEKANAPIATPKAVADDKPTERFTRTIIEKGTLTEEMLQGMEEKVLLGGFSYKMVSDESAQKKADSAVLNGTAEDIWEETVNGDKITKNKIAIGERLLNDAIEKGDVLNVLKLSSELADIFTRAGQVVQAARLLKKMTGAGRLVSLQRTVKTLNKDMRKKHGEDFPPIKISEGAARRLAEAKTQDGIEHAYQEAMQEVAEQMPVTFLDKYNAWRYFAMLSNPKTHIRNVVGNAIFVPATRIRYFLAAVGEQTVSRDKRTKAIAIKKEYRDFAKKDSKDAGVKNLLKGNKYDDKSALREKQRIFKTEVLEFLTRFNSNALEAEDMLFKNKHYIHALSGFLQARGIDLKNVSQEVLDEARIYAVNEAKKATFNDESALANWVQNFGNKNFATNIMVEGVLPFKRTPINIVKRGIEYSPLGLTKTLTKGLYDVKKGKITVTEFIDGLASGLTGTGIMLAGMFLANLGCITGGEDDDEKSQFEKWLGKQEYAVEILGKSYTVDWAAPANIPFFIGVEIVNTINEGEDFSFSKFGNAVWNSLEPITNLSMLSGMQSVIESARYAEPSQTLSAIASDAITSYAMQGLPSLFGAVGRTIDPTQRSWYTDKNDKWLDSTAQAVKNNIQSKVPGLSYTQIPKIDMWGREVSRGGVGERVLENFVSPGYYSKIEVTETSEELKRIFNKTDIDVFPNIAAKSFDIDGKTKYLTAGEYVTYAKAKGSYSLDYVKEFMDSAAYKKLTDEERADVIQSLYEYSNAKAKTTVSDYDLMKRYKTVTDWERNGNSAVDYYISRAISK